MLTERGRLLLVKASPERFEKVAEMDFGEPGPAAKDAAATTRIDGAATAARPVLRFPAWNAPILSHGLLYVRGKDQLICLDAAPAGS